MTERYDAIVIGAGHNGLVCAASLARSGLQVLLCEASPAVGGMAAERRFGADSSYRVPGLAHLSYPLAQALRDELDLDGSGYSPAAAVDTIALSPDAGPLVIGRDSLSGRPPDDAADVAAYPAFRQRLRDFSAALAPLFDSAPPRLKNLARGDKLTLARLGWRLRFGLGRDAMYEFLRIAGMNIYDVLDEAFADEALKGVMAFDAVIGSTMGPRTPGTVLTWLQRLHGERNGPLAPANGTLVAALERSARAAGVTLRCNCRVERIIVTNGRAAGVMLSGDEEIEAGLVVSAVDPRVTFGQLVGAPRLDAMFARRVAQIRGTGVVGKLHLGLSGLPEFKGVEADQLRDRLVAAPSMRYVERAFNASKYGELPERPALEITLPSIADPALAPAGHHVMSINVAYVPHAIKGGWERHAPKLISSVLAELEKLAPGIESLVIERDFLSPADIEREYGAALGHWHHGELTMHQSFMLRPVYGAAQYDTSVEQLYLCSAGCHPGGGITGLPGRNAARRILGGGKAA
ncbi:MAG: NAD(P)/FAD-dependent oxidoreductase [Woeseiaceae bacterium]